MFGFGESMHLREIKIRHIRSIRALDWSLDEHEPSAGWHVIVGDNGSGKSSLLRSVALALIGPKDAPGLRSPWEDWLRKESVEGSVELRIVRNLKCDVLTQGGQPPKAPTLDLGLKFVRTMLIHNKSSRKDQKVSIPSDSVTLVAMNTRTKPDRHAWGTGVGWFSAAYGPFRRFTGGDPDFRYMSLRFPRLARYLSIFDERVALTESLEWLRDLKFKSLEKVTKSHPTAGSVLLPAVIGFINQEDFLPFHAHLQEITSDSVQFLDGNGQEVRIEDLSDGYRSILSMTFELIRQLVTVYGPDGIFDPEDPGRVIAEGVVLIDEIDVHLHPTWQRRIGFWFRKHFPNIQFLVTTHSPLICPAAEVGSIFMLPRPGEIDPGERLRGSRLQRLINGNVLDAYGTEVFGAEVTRSEPSKRRLRDLAELNVKEVTGGLTGPEREEQSRLRAAMPTRSSIVGGGDDPNP